LSVTIDKGKRIAIYWVGGGVSNERFGFALLDRKRLFGNRGMINRATSTSLFLVLPVMFILGCSSTKFVHIEDPSERVVSGCISMLPPSGGEWYVDKHWTEKLYGSDPCEDRLRLASGGHTRPVLLLRGAPPRFVDAEVGSVVGIASGLTFEGAELRLGPGDALFLYTDGVTEAHDPDDQLFGEERLLEHLSRNAESEPRALAQSVRAAVAAFAREAPQFDDIAILVVRRPLAAGKAVVPVAASRLEVPATPEGLVAASRWLGEWCKASGAGVAATHDLDLALDELVANVMDHGYGPDGSGTVRLFVELAGDNVRLEIRDSCPAFDPLQAPEPGARAEAGYGGLGIELVRRTMNSVEYVRENGENRVILERRRDT